MSQAPLARNTCRTSRTDAIAFDQRLSTSTVTRRTADLVDHIDRRKRRVDRSSQH